MSFAHRSKATVTVSDEQIQHIHAQLCTSLVLQGKPLRLGDKITIKAPCGLVDEVIVRHIEIHQGFYVASFIPEDLLAFDVWHMIRALRAENNELKRAAA